MMIDLNRIGGGPENYVPEGMVTDEIRQDLLKLGWIVVEDDGSSV